MSRSILIAPATLLAGPLVALVASAPAAARVADDQIAFASAWLAVAGLTGVPLAGLIAAMRVARRSLGDLAPRSTVPLLWGGAVWLFVSIPAEAILGIMLKTTTHHRPLAGATFAAMSVAVNGMAALTAWRFTASALPRLPPRAREKEFALGIALSASVLLFLVIVLTALASGGASDPHLGDRVQAMLIDGTLAVIATALAALWDVPPGRAQAASWGGAGALVAMLVLALLLHSPTLSRKVAVEAPFAAAIGQTVGLYGETAESPTRHP